VLRCQEENDPPSVLPRLGGVHVDRRQLAQISTFIASCF
jgi:hypothetical protein